MGDEVYMSPWLGRFDEIYIKLVLYHELCHCLISYHSDSFYALLDRKLQNGSTIEKEFYKVCYVDAF